MQAEEAGLGRSWERDTPSEEYRVSVLSLLGLELQQSPPQLKEQSRFGFNFSFDFVSTLALARAQPVVAARLLQQLPGAPSWVPFQVWARSRNKLTMASSFSGLINQLVCCLQTAQTVPHSGATRCRDLATDSVAR